MNARLTYGTTDISGPQVTRETMLKTLRGLLRDCIKLRNEGVGYAKLAHAQGYADGYMRLLVESGTLTTHELLELVRDVRRGVDGPETRNVVYEDADLSA